MTQKHRREYLKSVGAVALILGWSVPAMAQEAPEPAAEADAAVADQAAASDPNDAQLDGPDIVVTGSSIRGAPAVGSNLISVGREAIEDNAVSTVQELLKTIPQVTGAQSAGQGSFAANDSAGAAVPQIHGLGGSNSSSTLVVVDGHRFPLTGIIRNLPDPNFIPTNAIERVEVLAEGASSIYGSDATAGVLNFITRRKFSGVEATAQHSWADGKKDWSATLSLGTRWDTGGGAVFYSYSDRGALSNADRPEFGDDLRARGGSNFGNFNCSPASIQPAGQSLIFLYPYTGPGIVNSQANAPCGQSQYRDMVPQERRHSVMVKLDQEVGDRLTLSGDMVFSSRTNVQRNPVAIASSTGSQPSNQNITATVFGPGSGKGGQINPFYVNPTGLEGATQQTIRWDGNDLFPEGAKSTGLSETFYGHARAEYEISDDWQIAAFTVVGMNTAKATITGSICQSCFLMALNGTTNGAGNLNQPSIPNTNVFVNQVPLTVDNAIDIWNPLATNRTNPEVLRRIMDSRNYQSARQIIQQYNVTANGKLFSLPGGDVRVAIGGEIVKYNIETEVVEPNNTGPSSTGSSFNAFKYLRTVKAAYGELLIPVVGEDMEVPGVKSFVLNVSGRIDHYNEFGSIENPKFAFNWEVIDGLKIRGNYATSFVAPQFSTYGPDRLSGIDGRSVDTFFGPQNGTLQVDLAVYPEARGIPGCNAEGQQFCTLGTAAIPGMRLDGANPDVTPSTGKTWAIGADFSPTFLPGFNASVTYWHTTIKETSGGPPLGIVLYSEKWHDLLKIYPNGATPEEIEAYRGGRRQRSPLASGPIYFGLDFRNFNVYTLFVEGIDFDVNYRHRFDWGSIRGGIAGTYKTRFDQTAWEGEPVFSVLNKNRFNGTFPSNRLDLRGSLAFEVGNAKASIFATHTGKYTFWGSTALNPVTTTNGVPTGGGDKVKGYTTVDLNLSYDLSDMLPAKVEVFLDANNVFDKMPPFVNISGGYDSLIAFPMGRAVTIGARLAF